MMKLRFHPNHATFDPGMTFTSRMNQAEAAELFSLGDKANLDKIVEGYAWLAGDIAGRVLHKLNLPACLGEDLTGEGLVAIVEAVYNLKECPDNVSAYLSKVIENKLIEVIDANNLCPVPTRTKRDRAAKGRPSVNAPRVELATDLAVDDEENNDSVLSRLRRSSCPNEFETPEHLYEYCQDQLDRTILDLRYDGGAGPRAVVEVADLAGVSRGTVEKRLKMMETRIYHDLGKRIPNKRTKGKRTLKPRIKRSVEAGMSAMSV